MAATVMIIYIFFSNNITMSNHSFLIKTAISQRKLFLFFFPKIIKQWNTFLREIFEEQDLSIFQVN